MGGAEEAELINKLLATTTVTGNTVGAALSVIRREFEGRFKREPTKPLDLTHFTSRAGVDASLLAAFNMAGVDGDTLASVTAAFDTLHLRCIPKVGFGTASAHRHLPDSKPLKVAYDHGVRLMALTDPIPIMPVDVDNVRCGNDLRECDLDEDTVLMSSFNPLVKGECTEEQARTLVRASFDSLISQLEQGGTLKRKAGEPLIDCYMMMMPFGLCQVPGMKPLVDLISVSELWEQMEALVDEGLVRTLGFSNLTQQQVDALLDTARILPSFASFERHILNPVDEYLAFVSERKLASIAAVPLGKGDVLDSKCLAHASMTPAQAALQWNISAGVSVIPGVETMEHIVENAATASMLDTTPITATQVEEPLRKIFPVWEKNCGNLMFKTGTKSDVGIFETRADGKLYAAFNQNLSASEDPGELKKDMLGTEQKKLLADVADAICELDIGVSPMAKRMLIDGHILSMVSTIL